MSLRGRAVVVTGAARGIGAATARELAARGARVSLVGLEPQLLDRLATELGAEHRWFSADVTNSQQLTAAMTKTAEAFGGIHAVIANAGIANYGTVHTASPDAFARTVEVNLIGAYRTAAAAVPHLVDRRGYLLLVASVASFAPMPGGAAYAASKAGVESLAASLRMELAGEGVAVGSAHPGWVDTDLVRQAEAAMPTFAEARAQLPWPVRGTTSVEQCAAALARAVERRATRVYVPREVAVVAMIRSLMMWPRLQAVTRRRNAQLIRRLDDEVRALGS